MDRSEVRHRVEELSHDSLAHGDAFGWFEQLYRRAHRDGAWIPWFDGEPNPHLVDWLAPQDGHLAGAKALVVGCGLGDDAASLAAKGCDVTAFDYSAEAVAWARDRFPESGIRFEQANLFDLPAGWRGAFDLVVEIYTLQALPPDVRGPGFHAVAETVAPGGRLLVIARGWETETDPPDGPPWPLRPVEFRRFDSARLAQHAFDRIEEQNGDGGTVLRYRAEYRRPRA